VPKLRNLVLVACHAVFIGSDYSKAEDQDAWLLLDYQKVQTLIKYFAPASPL